MARASAFAAVVCVLLGCATSESTTRGEEEPMNQPSNEATYPVEAVRIFDAPVERVWRAWSEGEEVKQWWGPHGFTTPIAEMDFREGGSSFVCMQAPAAMGNALFCNTWTYSRIVPHERVEYTLHFTDAQRNRVNPADMPGMPKGIPNGVPHVLTFKPLDGNRTEMTLTEYGYTTKEAQAQSSAGLEQVLDKLAARLAST